MKMRLILLHLVSITTVVTSSSVSSLFSHHDIGHEMIYRTHGVDPAALGFVPVPKNVSYENVRLGWKGSTNIPSFLNGTFYRGAPGQWPDGYWLDGLITLNSFAFRDGNIEYSMQYNKDDAFNDTVPTGTNPDTTTKGTIPHPANSSFPTGVSFRRVGDHLLTNTGVTCSNEVDPHTLEPISMPFQYDDDLGAPYVGPTHAQVVDDVVLHHFVRHVQDTDGDQTYVVTSIEPGSTKREVIASIEKPKASSWSGKASFQHMTLATSEYYIMLESSCYYPDNVTKIGVVDWHGFKANELIKTHIRVIDRKTGESKIWPLSTRLFSIHTINAYVEENVLVLDTIKLLPGFLPCSMALTKTSLKDMIENWTSDAKGKKGSYVVRVRVPLDRVGETLTPVRVGNVTGMEFPTIRYDELNGKKYDHMYACMMKDPETSGYYDSILKLNVQTGESQIWPNDGAVVYPNEPVFVPNPHGTSEDDGVILADVMYTEDNSTYLVILNASNMEEIGRAGPTPRIIPHGFHGRYLVW